MGQNWEKFRLLTWKNWLLQWRHPIQTAIEILAPVIFAALLVLIRGLVIPKDQEQRIYNPFSLANNNHSQVINLQKIAYSPCNNTAITQIMNDLATSNNFTNTCYVNAQSLQNALWDNTLATLAGVVFDDSLSGRQDLDKDLEITLRFPSELRTTTGGLVDTWVTNLIFPIYQMAGPRSPNSTTGAPPNYFNEGFLFLQSQIAQSLIRYYDQDETQGELPEVFMQRFPYPNWISDPLQVALQSFVGLMFMLSFVYPCINTVKVITAEKEKQLKEAMKIMGLPNWLHWTAWFIKVFVLLVISIILMLVLLNVPWFYDSHHSVFTLADPTLLFVFLLFYASATITFCFAISVFFSKANTATTIAGLAWFMSYSIWVFLQEQYGTLSLAEKMLICLASNSAMAFGFQVTLMWEGTGEGLVWSNFFQSVTPDDYFTMAHIVLMLIIDTFLYLFIALYVEAVFPGEFGVPKPWYFPFTRSFWCGNRNNIETPDLLKKLPSDVYEEEPTDLNVGIRINELTKVYSGKKVAVRNLSFNMFENQITVLLGHNGAGKTTTMMMLTGMITPTSGTALVNGYDIRTNMPDVRDSLGLCPQHNILFDDLTVEEHLYFFSKLKGLNGKEIDQEITTYIELLELVPKRRARSSTLSGGMKRKLCVAMAMCGRSKVCMLDEPTAGMDPAARRALWDMILKQKKDRTILLSTHFMDEADLLGDRIAIMAGGQLQCYGASFFLKKRYGAGYHLIMDKSSDCQVERVTTLLRQYIPNLKAETNIGSELSYVLAEDQSDVFENMLSDLEKNSGNLGVNSYGISLTTMEEVFMKVGADHGQEEINNGEDAEDQMLETQTNKSATLSNDSRVNITGPVMATGAALWFNQLLAMFMKKIKVTQRNWILLIVQNIIPIAFIIITMIVARLMNMGTELPSLPLSLHSFGDPVTVVTNDGSAGNVFYQRYVDLLHADNMETMIFDPNTMIESMLNYTAEYTSRVRMRHIIGASFSDDSITSWFNNEPFHSPPIALQHSMNAILQAKTNESHRMRFVNFPLPLSVDSRLNQINMGQTIGFQIAFNIAFCMAFVTPFYVLFYVRERVNKAKHLQFVSGAKVSAFWLAAVVWDFLTFMLTIICIVVTLAAFQEPGFSTAEELGRVVVVLIFFIMATLPITYLSAYIFDVPSTGYTRLALVKIFLGSAVFMVVQVLSIEGLDLVHVGEALHWIFSIVPHYVIGSAFFRMSSIHDTIDTCNQISDIIGISACFVVPDCCIDEDFFNLDTGIGQNLLYMLGVAIIATLILLLIEYRTFDRLVHKFQNQKNNIPTTEDTEDSDVLEEKRRVRSGEILPEHYTVVLKDLTKQYGNYLAVNQLCLGIKSYECFGLLGVNGAGKTTTFKMMTGDVVMSHGDGWICNLNLKTNMKQVHKNIGYCPQFDALLDELTGRETLYMYCLLRGLPFRDCAYTATQLAKEFDFYRHLNKPVKAYSGGNKRKLSSAIALIGDPPVVFLDEPTAGMDPATKRNLWNTLCRIRDDGKCLVLTSHSMEECEALCTRLVIMVNGAFKCLGSTQHLKSKFSEGYMLMVKVRKSGASGAFDEEEIAPIERFIMGNFPSAVLKENHQELLTYFIADTSIAWSKMFGIMERGKREIENLEDYSLGQSSLEQVFLLFTKQQRITADQ